MKSQKDSLTCILWDKHYSGSFHFDHRDSQLSFTLSPLSNFFFQLERVRITGPARDVSKRDPKIDIAKSRKPRKFQCRILNIIRILLVNRLDSIDVSNERLLELFEHDITMNEKIIVRC